MYLLETQSVDDELAAGRIVLIILLLFLAFCIFMIAKTSKARKARKIMQKKRPKPISKNCWNIKII